MSEMTLCNYCTLNGFRLEAKKEKSTVFLKPKPIKGFPKGVDVFKVKNGNKTWLCWFADVPEDCVC